MTHTKKSYSRFNENSLSVFELTIFSSLMGIIFGLAFVFIRQLDESKLSIRYQLAMTSLAVSFLIGYAIFAVSCSSDEFDCSEVHPYIVCLPVSGNHYKQNIYMHTNIFLFF